MKTMLISLFCLFFSFNHAFANDYNIAQGDVLRLAAPQQHGQHLKVEAFGKQWPIYTFKGKQVAWIAIHLKTKPATYPIVWSNKQQTWHDQVKVVQGNFRISHISVKKSMSSFNASDLKRIRADQQAIKTSYQTSIHAQPVWPEMQWPVAGIISTPFAAQRYVNGHARSPHSGIDIAAPEGTSVYAPLAGKVLLVADMYLNGNLIAIAHGDGITTIYAHLKRALVKEGQYIKAGEIFAEVGSTGRSTGPHLHWGVHFLGAKINPRSMLSPIMQQQKQPTLGAINE